MQMIRVGGSVTAIAAVVVVAVAALVRALGHGAVADTLDALARFLGPDMTLAALVTAAVAALIDAAMRVRDLVREIRRRQTHVTPPAQGGR